MDAMICDRCQKYVSNPRLRDEAIARLEPVNPASRSHAADMRCHRHLFVKLQGWATHVTVTPLPGHEDEVEDVQRRAGEWAVPVPA